MSLPAQGRVVSICIALRGKIGWGEHRRELSWNRGADSAEA